MPRYLLEPVDDHEDWKTSTHTGPVRVTAPDEDTARFIADAAFRRAAERGSGGSVLMSPWTNPERVSCKAEPPAGLLDVEQDFPPKLEVIDASTRNRPIGEWGALSNVAQMSGETWNEYTPNEFIEQTVSYLRANGHDVDDAGNLSTDQTDDEQLPEHYDMRAMANLDEYDGVYRNDPDDEFPHNKGKPFDEARGESNPNTEREPVVWGKGRWGEGTWGGGEDDPDEISFGKDGNPEEGAEFTGKEDRNVSDDHVGLNEASGDDDEMGPEPNATRSGFSGGFSNAFGGAPRSSNRFQSPKVVVRHILSNPYEYRFLAQELERVLTHIADGKYATSMNEHPLWGTLDNTSDLENIFAEIRDELRQFNRLLREQQVPTEKLEESTVAVRSKIVDGFATVANSLFGKTVQVGLGGFVLAYMYQFGLAMGVPPLEPSTMAVMKQFLPGGD